MEGNKNFNQDILGLFEEPHKKTAPPPDPWAEQLVAALARLKKAEEALWFYASNFDEDDGLEYHAETGKELAFGTKAREYFEKYKV